MFDPDVQKVILERVAGDGIAEGAVEPGATGPGTDALWRSWLATGYELQALGIAPGAMCDATNEVASARAEFESARHHEHERTARA